MRLGYSNSEFPPRAFPYARKSLARVLKAGPETVLERIGCRRVSFLVVAFTKVDSMNESRPSEAVALAKALVKLADRIPVDRDDLFCYQSERERLGFRYLALAVLTEALHKKGEIEEAKIYRQPLTRRLDAMPRYVAADVRRRLSVLSVYEQDFSKAIELLAQAKRIFEDLKLRDMIALCQIRLGTVLNVQFGSGHGSELYATALWHATLMPRTRLELSAKADRIGCAASLALARDWASVVGTKPDEKQISEVLRYVRATWQASDKPTINRGVALLVEGQIADRNMAYRRSVSLMMRAFRVFLKLDAYTDAATCIASMLEVRIKSEPEDLPELVEEIRAELAEYPSQSAAWIAQCLASSSDPIQALRKQIEERGSVLAGGSPPRRCKAIG